MAENKEVTLRITPQMLREFLEGIDINKTQKGK